MRSEDDSSLGNNSDGEALQQIVNKLSDVRNLKDLQLKHYHISSAHFKKRTTHLDIPGKVHDLYQHVVKTCPFCNSSKPRLDRSRVSGCRADEFGDLISWILALQKLDSKPLDVSFVLDGATSHVPLHQKSFPNSMSGWALSR